MKKLLVITATVFFLAVLISYRATAQNSIKADYAKLASGGTDSKKFSAPLTTNENRSLISVRAMRDFKKSYKSSSQETWYKTDEGCFLVKFTLNGIKNRADYNKKGTWIATTRYYSEKELPKDIRAQVKSVYYDFAIITVQEITFPEHLVYIVHVEGETKWMNIRICDGEMDVMEELLKQ